MGFMVGSMFIYPIYWAKDAWLKAEVLKECWYDIASNWDYPSMLWGCSDEFSEDTKVSLVSLSFFLSFFLKPAFGESDIS